MKLTKGILGLLICSALQIAAQFVILTSDQQLDGLTNPDKKMDLSVGYKKNICSLREICEEKKSKGWKEERSIKNYGWRN